MEAVLTNILNVVPGWLALVLMLGGFAFYVLGAIRLGYGATVRPLVLDLIERAEHEIQGTKRGAERSSPGEPDGSSGLFLFGVFRRFTTYIDAINKFQVFFG